MQLQSFAVPIAKAKKLLMHPVLPGWPQRVRDAARDQKKELKEVAQAGGVTSQTLSGLLAGKYRHSIAIPKINAFLGLDDAAPATDRDRALALLDSMDPETRTTWLATGAKMARPMPPTETRGHTAGVIEDKIARMRAGLKRPGVALGHGAVLPIKDAVATTTEVGTSGRRAVRGRS